MGARKSNAPLLIGGAAALTLGALALSSRGEISEAVSEAAAQGVDWLSSIIDRVSHHEGGFDAINPNRDGAGLSFGMLQWAQEPGSLGTLLAAMHRADAPRFRATFGPDYQALLNATRSRSLAPVAGALLWKSPWVERFKAAGGDPVFQAVQRQLAVDGPYFQAALACGEILGIRTQRSLALFMDAAVQQGPGTARQIASRVQAGGGAGAGRQGEMTLLVNFAIACAAPFVRTQPPTGPHAKAPRLVWRQTGPSEWHVMAGEWDLFKDITRRRMGILNDASLSDAPIALAEV